MIRAEEVKKGIILTIEAKLYRAVGIEFGGTARAGRIMHLKLRRIPDGHYQERTAHGNDTFENVSLERRNFQYLYNDTKSYYFMDLENYNELAIPSEVVASAAPYLKEHDEIAVEFYQGEPVNIILPEAVELKVAQAPLGLRQADNTTTKEVVLENGMKVLVPQFIKEGDFVKIDVASGKYLERLKKEYSGVKPEQ